MDWPKQLYRNTRLSSENLLTNRDKDLAIIVGDGKQGKLQDRMRKKFPELEEEVSEDGIAYIDTVVRGKVRSIERRVYAVAVEAPTLSTDTLRPLAKDAIGRGKEEIMMALENTLKMDKIRKVMEICPKDEEMKVVISGGDPKGDGRRTGAIRITAGTERYADVLTRLKKSVEQPQRAGKIKSVRATKEKDLLIITSRGSADEAQKHLKLALPELQMKNIRKKKTLLLSE